MQPLYPPGSTRGPRSLQLVSYRRRPLRGEELDVFVPEGPPSVAQGGSPVLFRALGEGVRTGWTARLAGPLHLDLDHVRFQTHDAPFEVALQELGCGSRGSIIGIRLAAKLLQLSNQPGIPRHDNQSPAGGAGGVLSR